MVDIVDIESVFDNAFTNKFGFPKERPATKVKGYLLDNVKDFIRQSPMMVMATSAADGSCDASPKGGLPGFVKVLDDSTLLIPDVAGNNLFQSYINMSENAQIGIVFFIPGIRETVRVNGRVKLIDKEELERLEIELEVNNPDDNSRVQQGIVVEIEEAYGPCPRALAFSKFWDTAQLEENKNMPSAQMSSRLSRPKATRFGIQAPFPKASPTQRPAASSCTSMPTNGASRLISIRRAVASGWTAFLKLLIFSSLISRPLTLRRSKYPTSIWKRRIPY